MDAYLAPPGLTTPAGTYEVGGHEFEITSPDFAQAIAEAHATQRRPRCMCVAGGVEMYVARLGDGYIVKRMPNTGSHHAPHCPSYEPPAELSGLAQVLGSAITEDPATGETTLKLDFPLAKIPGRSVSPCTSSASGSVASDGTKLSLQGLLHYLWDEAELTRWRPGFAGKRSWATVRKHLMQAAEHKTAGGLALGSRLYIPEVFSVEQRAAINARRHAYWSHAVAAPGKPQELMLLIAEVKEVVPARFGYKAVIKHVPDQAFAMNERLYRRMAKVFDASLSLWGASHSAVHMVMIATFSVGEAGVPTLLELALMLADEQWIPFEDSFEQQVVNRLVCENRSFAKALRYNLPTTHGLACAILVDTQDAPVELYVQRPGSTDAGDPSALRERTGLHAATRWAWRPADESMPALPARTTSQHRSPNMARRTNSFPPH